MGALNTLNQDQQKRQCRMVAKAINSLDDHILLAA